MDGTARILVVDDAGTVTLLVSRALEAAGYDVTVSNDGHDAWQTGLAGDFDLALLDYLLPSMLGSEVLQRWSEAAVPFPTIVLSAVEDEHTVVQLLQLGAVDFIRKPFSVTELLIRVRHQLNASHAPGWSPWST